MLKWRKSDYFASKWLRSDCFLRKCEQTKSDFRLNLVISDDFCVFNVSFLCTYRLSDESNNSDGGQWRDEEVFIFVGDIYGETAIQAKPSMFMNWLLHKLCYCCCSEVLKNMISNCRSVTCEHERKPSTQK